jgi:hypothetical protein
MRASSISAQFAGHPRLGQAENAAGTVMPAAVRADNDANECSGTSASALRTVALSAVRKYFPEKLKNGPASFDL